MSQQKNEELWNKIIEYSKDGYIQADIARMVGVSRQRVSVIMSRYLKNSNKIYTDGTKLSDYQLSKLEGIIFPNIRKYLVENNINIVKFCNDVKKEGKKYRTVLIFLYGETENTSVEMIGNILKVTGMSFEEAFRKDGE